MRSFPRLHSACSLPAYTHLNPLDFCSHLDRSTLSFCGAKHLSERVPPVETCILILYVGLSLIVLLFLLFPSFSSSFVYCFPSSFYTLPFHPPSLLQSSISCIYSVNTKNMFFTPLPWLDESMPSRLHSSYKQTCNCVLHRCSCIECSRCRPTNY